MVRDVSCKNCDAKLGWIYEFATEESQRYKEGRVILERALVTESDGFDERGGDSDGALNNSGASNQVNVGGDGDGDYLAIE